jgi:Cd2+/Zn2+-exporting ATPase
MLTLAVAAEIHSNHPVAQAVVRVAKEAKIAVPEAADIREEAGKGVSCRVNDSAVMIGRETWLKDEGVDFAGFNVDPKEMEGYSVLYISENKRVIGWIGLEDRARPEARKATAELRKLGIRRLTMFTGDRWSVARRVAQELGCTEVEAECLPDRKLSIVHQMKGAGMHVAVVGDGVNDAPALAAGDIGIAMGAAGSDIAIHSASIALMSNDLSRLPFLIRLSRRTRAIVNQNLLFALLFIVVGLTLAITGVVEPITAAGLHVIGSFIVIFNSARLVRFGEELTPYTVPRQAE